MKKNVKPLMIVLILIIVISLVGLGICVAYVFKINNDSNDLPKSEESSSVIVITENKSDAPEQQPDSGEDDFTVKIDTKYGVFKYPKDLAENLETEEKTENGIEKIDFNYVVDDRKIELFTVCFGEVENGFVCGYFAEDKMIPISIVFSEFSEEDSNSPEEFEIVCMMQEAVNVVIDSALENENFVKAN